MMNPATHHPNESLGRRIRKLRKRGRMSLDHLARKVELHAFDLAGIERGQRRVRLDTALRLLQELGVDVGSLPESIAPMAAGAESQPLRTHASVVVTGEHAEPLPSQDLRKLGRQAVDEGRYQDALEIYNRDYELAQNAGEQGDIDLAWCNRSAVLIALGDYDSPLPRLRQILLRSRDDANCYLAAYNLSRAYEHKKSYKKSLFYARLARDRALLIERPEWLITSHNQIGNCLTDESLFTEAVSEYERALELSPDGLSLRRAALLCNRSYCLMMLGDLAAGQHDSRLSLSWFQQLGARAYEVFPHLDLCFAHIEEGDLEMARAHGRQALDLAELAGDPERIKAALFLLGETERCAGNTTAARSAFADLQQRFYPESPNLAELMGSGGMLQVINLRS